MMLIASVRYEGEIQVVKNDTFYNKESLCRCSPRQRLPRSLYRQAGGVRRGLREFLHPQKIAAVEDASRTDTGGGSSLFIGVLKF